MWLHSRLSVRTWIHVWVRTINCPTFHCASVTTHVWVCACDYTRVWVCACDYTRLSVRTWLHSRLSVRTWLHSCLSVRTWLHSRWNVRTWLHAFECSSFIMHLWLHPRLSALAPNTRISWYGTPTLEREHTSVHTVNHCLSTRTRVFWCITPTFERASVRLSTNWVDGSHCLSTRFERQLLSRSLLIDSVPRELLS